MTLTEKLLQWYEKNGRDLPWRVKGGAHPRPYEVWLSEIMLQQTTVKTVIPYFNRFLTRFPDIFSLAEAPLQDVLMLWQGLGYYTRAKKLHECANIIVRDFGGRFPDDRAALMKLPGVGAYTSAAIASLAFNKPEAAVDGNVVRTLCRIKGWDKPVRELSKQIETLAQTCVSRTRAADYASAIMDFGATVCTPKNPLCDGCPLRQDCQALKNATVSLIPAVAKTPKAGKSGYVFIITDGNGGVLLRRRTEKGLLSGLTEMPWNTDCSFPFENGWEISKAAVSHTFTHFRLTLTLVSGRTEDASRICGGFFAPVSGLDGHPFSSLMKKVIKTAKKHQMF